MIKLNYKVTNFRGQGRVLKTGFAEITLLGEIYINDRRFIVYESNEKAYIEEIVGKPLSTDIYSAMDYVEWVEDEALWKTLFSIAQKEGLISNERGRH